MNEWVCNEKQELWMTRTQDHERVVSHPLREGFPWSREFSILESDDFWSREFALEHAEENEENEDNRTAAFSTLHEVATQVHVS